MTSLNPDWTSSCIGRNGERAEREFARERRVDKMSPDFIAGMEEAAKIADKFYTLWFGEKKLHQSAAAEIRAKIEELKKVGE